MGIERVIDAIAAFLHLDPLRVRRINLYGGAGRNVTPYHMTVEDNVLTELMDELVTSASYEERRSAIEAFNRAGAVIRRGIALDAGQVWHFLHHHLSQPGGCAGSCVQGWQHPPQPRCTEMGQGLFIKVAQVVADAFRVDMERVKVSATNTGKVPNTSATAASAGSDMNAMAALDACEKIRRRLVFFAAEKYAVEEEDIGFEHERVRIGEQIRTWPELVMEAYLGRVSLSATGYYRTPKIHYDRATASGRPFLYFAYGAAVSEVEVDTLTGEHRLCRVDILHDVGRSLNPAIDMDRSKAGLCRVPAG